MKTNSIPRAILNVPFASGICLPLPSFYIVLYNKETWAAIGKN